MRLDQKAVVVRVSRRRLVRHAAALRAAVGQARAGLEAEADPGARERLAGAIGRIEGEIARMEAEAARAPTEGVVEHALLYDCSARD